MKLIYIMGAGHIGSTVFDIALSTHPQIESLGEISKFHRFGWKDDENRRCACDSSVFRCPFWTEIKNRWSKVVGERNGDRYLYLQKQIEGSRLGWARFMINKSQPSSEFAEYIRMSEALYRAVQEVSGKQFLVDSSLSPRRAYAISMNPDIDLYLIHFIRDGRGCIWSLKKPGKKIFAKEYIPAPASRTAKYWVSANLQSTLTYNRLPEEKRMRIRYEDFVTDPELILNQVGSWLGLNLSGIVVQSHLSASHHVRHTVGGNRVRMLKDIRIKPDFEWMEKLPDKDRKLFWLMAGWLARKYGYIQNPVY